MPEVLQVALRRSRRPARWRPGRGGLVLGSSGRLLSTVSVPTAGLWSVWVKGQLMRPLGVWIDGHELATVSDQLDGNSLVVGSAPPIQVHLGAGTHQVELERGNSSLAPGDGERRCSTACC